MSRTCGTASLAVVALLLGCVTVGRAQPPAFDGARAQEWIERQCALGPRVPGTAAHAAWIRMATDYFASLGLPCEQQSFRRVTALGPDTLQLTNLLVRIRPELRPRLLLGSHWDSRPWADEDPDPAKRRQPVPGANDGASSSAILFELARILREHSPSLGVDLAFFDLEDLGRPGSPEEYCQGSLEMVRRWTGAPPDWVVVLDMVGSDRTEFGRELASAEAAPELLDLIFRLAAERGYTEWNPQSQLAVVDDHLPFQAAGIPAVVLIGFNDPYWHTLRDDPAATSPRRLGRVGTVMLDLIYGGHLAPQ